MISKTLQIMMFAALAVYFLLLFFLLRKKRLNLKYTLLWLFSGVFMLILAICPQIVSAFSRLVGIQLPVNAVFAVAFFCVLMILMSLTVIVSRLNEQVKQLTQHFALLEKRVRDAEHRQAAAETQDQTDQTEEQK